MQQILQAINSSAFTQILEGDFAVAPNDTVWLSAINPGSLTIDVGDGSVANIVMLHGGQSAASIEVKLAQGASLNLTELYVGVANVDVKVIHHAAAHSNVVAVSLNHNSTTYNMQLCGADAHSDVNTLQMGSDKDDNSIEIKMQHLSADCSSHSLSKCAASGQSTLHFDGLVYVAKDAQRTAADQNCRSILLSDAAHILARPQLEIYADDVKCSHGATMGQVDTDAILYMRQRGLSQVQARRLQIEGFVNDVIAKCRIDGVCEPLGEIITEKLQQM